MLKQTVIKCTGKFERFEENFEAPNHSQYLLQKHLCGGSFFNNQRVFHAISVP